MENDNTKYVAKVKGEAWETTPLDLYIPPNALLILLESFEGPLDLLLYLIKRHKFEITDLPIIEITKQYMEYVQVMKSVSLELAGEYLVMASVLTQIKSKMLLPRTIEEDEEDDPRAKLAQKLIEYAKFKQAAEQLDSLPRENRDFFHAQMECEINETVTTQPDLHTIDLLTALKETIRRAENYQKHNIKREELSTRDRMKAIVGMIIGTDKIWPMHTFYENQEGRKGIIVAFLSILEMAKEQMIDIIINSETNNIYIKAKSNENFERVLT